MPNALLRLACGLHRGQYRSDLAAGLAGWSESRGTFKVVGIEKGVLKVDLAYTHTGPIGESNRTATSKHKAKAIWQLEGKRAAIITGRRSKVVDVRAAELGIDPVVQGAADKLAGYRQVLAATGHIEQAREILADIIRERTEKWVTAYEIAIIYSLLNDHDNAFLWLETAQYYMAYIVRQWLEQGYFESVTIDRNRLYSQILDNLNKAAVIGFPHSEIAARLDSAYYGDPAQRRVYADAPAAKRSTRCARSWRSDHRSRSRRCRLPARVLRCRRTQSSSLRD